MHTLWKAIERFAIPAALVHDWRASFLVRVWGFGTAFGFLFGTLALFQSQYVLAAVQYSIVFAGMSLVTLLRVTKKLTLLTHLSLAVNTPFLAFAGLLQNPVNPITPVFLVLVPLTANFALGPRCMRIWLSIALAFGGLSEWLMSNGVHLDVPPRANPGVITALNLMALVLLVVAFVSWFDRMRLEVVQKLEAASRARTIFLANVSHEIRTPMNGVLGLTELMLAEPLEPRQRERVELVQRSGRSLVQLIDDLLLVTRAESGRLVLTSEPTSIHNLVCDVVELFTPVATQKGVTLRMELSDAVPTHVMLDGVRWRQVLVNLLSNAIKFTEHGEVVVRVLARDGSIVAEVEDHGIGIEPRVLERLFQPFEQGDDSMTRKYGGSGWGLRSRSSSSRPSGAESRCAPRPGWGARSPSRCR